MRDTFGRFVSLEISEKIMQSGADVLKGEQIEVTVMFVDIRGFTPFCEKFSPQEVVDFLNLYFSSMVGPITKEGGVVNKFIGDAVMAIFAPTFGVTDHAFAAVRAALGLRQALVAFNEQHKYPPVKIGVGCHTGPLVAGNVGTKERMEYTVIGDTVNIASRIQSQSKVFQTDLLISQDTLQKIDPTLFPGVAFVAYEPVLMKGKSQPLTLYRLDQV